MMMRFIGWTIILVSRLTWLLLTCQIPHNTPLVSCIVCLCLVQQHLANDGLMVVQSTSPYYAPKSFWSINKTIEASGFATTPYHTYVPSFGEWGYIIGQPLASSRLHPFTPPQTYDLPMKFLTPAVSNAMFEFSADMTKPVAEQLEVNTIDKQPLVRYYHQDWSDE